MTPSKIKPVKAYCSVWKAKPEIHPLNIWDTCNLKLRPGHKWVPVLITPIESKSVKGKKK